MDENSVVIVAGIVLSVLFSWVPKLKDWYNELSANFQRVVMLVALVAAVLLVYAASCTGFTIPGVTLVTTCDQDGLKGLIQLLIYAIVANQATFLMFPKSKE